MTNKLADAYDLLAEAYATLALELRNPAVERGGPAVETPGAPSLEELPFDDDLPAMPKRIHPDEWEREVDAEQFQDTPQGRSQSGGCPVHGLPWVARPAGTSKKTGAPYKAFWHCNEQNEDGSYCRQKPTAAWVKAHPIR